MVSKGKNASGRPIRYLVAKKALVRFANWAGWLCDMDQDLIREFLSYEPVTSAAA